jgi:hypothetical protein
MALDLDLDLDFGIGTVLSPLDIESSAFGTTLDVELPERMSPEFLNRRPEILGERQRESLRQRRVVVALSIMALIAVASVFADNEKLATVMAILMAWLSGVYPPK